MKSILFFCVAFFVITSSAISQLTSSDLDKIRLIVKEEIVKSEAKLKADITKLETGLKADIAKLETGLKADIAKSEKQLREYMDIRFNSIRNQLLLVVGFVSSLIVLIVVTIGIPQIIMAWRGKNERTQDRRIEELSREIEALKQQRIVQP
ncbi:hypothetical protein C6501_11005 [Candidatus Poribacteria bacterium]|nr:MAG: hypothetical protein C6501_11005 [Candidatus Poribacteria bacterium]